MSLSGRQLKVRSRLNSVEMPPAVCEDIATKGLQQCEILYGKALIENLAKELTARHGKGFDRSTLWNS